MAEQARKAAAQKQAAEELAAEHQAAALSSRLLTVEPGPSILKRKSDADGAPPPSKRARLDVKFADDAGKELCEVQFFEVDSFKRSTQGEKSKKTHKEMMKRERLLEKNDLLSKNRNSMQRTTDWTLPLALVLSLEIKENSHVEVHSCEKEEQEKRIVHKLEARYMDESLIPADPDDPAGNVGDDEVVEVQVIALKWDTEGDNVQSHASKVSTFSPSELFLFLLLTFPSPTPHSRPSPSFTPSTLPCPHACTTSSPSCCRSWCETSRRSCLCSMTMGLSTRRGWPFCGSRFHCPRWSRSSLPCQCLPCCPCRRRSSCSSNSISSTSTCRWE